jgi:UDP:flavonoid glycosyltransferase YjiC (YdhE family)
MHDTDQDLNTAQAEMRGFAKKLEILDWREEDLEKAINEILQNPK